MALMRGVDQELARVRARFRPHRHGLPAKDQFRSALAKPPPAADHLGRKLIFHQPIPPLHRLHRKSVLERLAVNHHAGQWLGQGGIGRAQDFIVARQIQVERRDVAAKIGHRFQGRYPDQRGMGRFIHPVSRAQPPRALGLFSLDLLRTMRLAARFVGRLRPSRGPHQTRAQQHGNKKLGAIMRMKLHFGQ